MTGLFLAEFGGLDWAIVVGYMLGVLGLGALVSGKSEDQEDYFLGGRSMPTWAVTLSVLATSLSAATYVGVPQMTFAAGGDLSYLILNVGGLLGTVAVAWLFLPRLYAAGTTTIYGALEQRHGEGGVIAASVAFLFGRFLASGARLFIAGIAFSHLLFDDLSTPSIVTAIVLFGVVGTAYTCMGGIRAVIWTDTLQILLVVGAALASIWFLLDAIPLGVGELWDVLQQDEKLTVVKSGFGPTGYDWAAGYTILTAFAVIPQYMGSYGCDQDLVQRMLTTKSAWRSSLSLVVSQVIGIPVVLLFLVIGLLLSVFYGHPELMGAAAPHDALLDDRGVYPQFLKNHMPTGLAGLAMAGMFAAAMSSLDSAVNALASSLVADVIRPLKRHLGGEAAATPTAPALPSVAPQEPGVSATPGSPFSPPTTAEPGREAPRSTPDEDLGAPRIAVVASGAILVVFAVVAALVQQGGKTRLIDFALGVMTFALSGLLGVFLATLLTKRGNVYSLIAALIAGAVAIFVIQKATPLAWPWWMLFSTPVSFGVCCLGSPRSAEPRGEVKAEGGVGVQ
ncbi:MAG: sodium:solute symporter [Planctomycetota bacterium]